jgi:uncharacterized protein (TIGR03790 family)
MKKLLLLLMMSGAALIAYQTQNCNLIIINGNVTGTCTTIPPPPSTTILPYADPSTVLVIVQTNGGSEPGTGTKNASQYVADYYMQRRNIPAGNIVRISTFIDPYPPPIGGFAHGDGGNRPNSECVSQIFTPVRSFLSTHPNIKYIVPVYGVPISCYDPNSTSPDRGYSLDSELSMILVGPSLGLPNPFYDADPSSSPAHIDKSTTNVMIVSRLDGPDAIHAAGLVDLAIKGEAGIKGTGYFDYGSNFPLGYTTLNAYNLCTAVVPAQTCVLHDNQNDTGKMLQSAPNTAFAWGGYDAYDPGPLWQAYSFVPGAVASSMNSNSAQSVRGPSSGSVVYWFLLDGVTATWGAVSEPYSTGYANGDNLLNHLWRGYTFGEAAYISSPWGNWKMVFIGDPLYLPKVQ